MTIDVSDNKLKITWNEAWGAWKQLVDSPEVKALIAKSTSTLEGASGKSKGKGLDKANWRR